MGASPLLTLKKPKPPTTNEPPSFSTSINGRNNGLSLHIIDSYKRHTLSHSDVIKDLSKSDRFDFLIDMISYDEMPFPGISSAGGRSGSDAGGGAGTGAANGSGSSHKGREKKVM